MKCIVRKSYWICLVEGSTGGRSRASLKLNKYGCSVNLNIDFYEYSDILCIVKRTMLEILEIGMLN